MEAILFCFFDKVFSDLDRGCLMARHKRRETVQYFSTLIQGCSQGENSDPVAVCGQAVRTAIDFHDEAQRQNGGVCLLGKFHNILYVAIKLCYDWKLNDNVLVCELLKNVFACEKTFERLIAGAIFGTRATQLISGWKSDFADRNECLKATEYFLDHAAKGSLMFDVHGRLLAMAAVPMESYGQATPDRVSVQAGRPDALALLIKYGAFPQGDPQRCGLQLLLRRLQQLAEYGAGDPFPEELIKCLDVYTKILPRVPNITYNPVVDEEPIVLHPSILNELPKDRSGFHPPELQHLCRCVIHYYLTCNGQVPYGAQQLNVPLSLQTYISFNNITTKDKTCL